MNHMNLLFEAATPLLYWYAASARDLPWRRDRDPYHIWISEIMLQQTRAEAVKPYFSAFLEAFPTPEALALADDDVLNKIWQGLGYYSRARNLKRAAQEIVSLYGGKVPDDYRQLLSLPGIGAYTAGAISSIAFGRPIPAVDGNVLRVVTRLTVTEDDITTQTTKDRITQALSEVYRRIPEESANLTQALMELGATVCVPNGTPHCGDCPLAEMCLAHRYGNETAYPKKAPKRARVISDRTVLLIRCEDRFAIQKRPEKGLLSGLWEFPNVEGCLGTSDVEEWLCSLGLQLTAVEQTRSAKHIFTHIEWHMTGYRCDVLNTIKTYTWATAEEIFERYSVPSAFRAFLQLLQ